MTVLELPKVNITSLQIIVFSFNILTINIILTTFGKKALERNENTYGEYARLLAQQSLHDRWQYLESDESVFLYFCLL